MPIDVLSVLCAQLTRDLLAIAKFLSHNERHGTIPTVTPHPLKGALNATGYAKMTIFDQYIALSPK